ncbi:mucin-2-like [Condylostylus longicornis]|uniref:mucin-2-like n=1 Tax=Condylostylus longicornis TaxID=2530218 RepID=UPI00244E4983|nr:mucin-2-like [Condylostylus longicornis]
MGNNIRIIIILIYAVLQLAIVIEAQAKIQSRGKTRFTPEASYYDDSLESLFKFRPQYNKSELSDEFYLDDELGSTRKSILVDVPRVTSKFSMSSHQFTKTRQTVKLLATTKDSRRKKDIKKRTDLQNNNNYASRRFDAFIRNPPIQGLRKSPLEQKIGKNEYDLFPKQEKRRRARQSSTTEVLKTKKEIDKRKSRLESSFLVDSKPVNKQKSPTEQKSETAMAPKLEIYVFPDIRRVSKSMNYNIYSHDEIGQLEDGNYTEHFKLFLKSESKPFKIDTSVNKTGRVKSSIVSSSSQSPSQLLTKRVISLSKKKRLTRSSTNNTNPISKTNSTLFQKYEVQNDLKASLNNLKSTLQYFNTTTDKTQKDKSRNKKFSEKQQNLSGENQRRFSSKFTTESTVSTVKTQNLENFSNFDVNKLKNSYKFSFSKFSSRYREPTSKLSLEQEKEKNRPVHTPKIPTMTVESSSRFPKIYTFETNSNKNSRKPIARSINKINSEQEGFWNIVDPIDDGLTKSEIVVDSSEEYVDDLYDEDEVHRPAGTATVSIFEALADILSKRTENPENVVKNKTTPSTTTSTTTTTTELPIIIQADNSSTTNINISTLIYDTLNITYQFNDIEKKFTTSITYTFNKSSIPLIRIKKLDSKLDNNNDCHYGDCDSRHFNMVHNLTSAIVSNHFPQLIAFINRKGSCNNLNQYQSTNSENICFDAHLKYNFNNNLNFTVVNRFLELLIKDIPETNSVTVINSNLQTSIPQPHFLRTPGSNLVSQPQLISAINNFLDSNPTKSVRNISILNFGNFTSNNEPLKGFYKVFKPNILRITAQPESTNSSTIITTTTSTPSTISLFDLFTIKPKKITLSPKETLVDIHPIYISPKQTTILTKVSSTDDIFQEIPKEHPVTLNSTLKDKVKKTQQSTMKKQIHSGHGTATTKTKLIKLIYKNDNIPLTTQNLLDATLNNNKPPECLLKNIQATSEKNIPSPKITLISLNTTLKYSTEVTSRNPNQQLKLLTAEQSKLIEEAPVLGYTIYGILPNNTVIRKIPRATKPLFSEPPPVYGILSNKTMENPVLLDILKRKYIKNDVSLKSQSVFSLTTLKSITEDETFDPIFKENVSDMSEQSSPISTTSKATSNINNTIKVTHSFSQGSNINEIGEFGLDDPLTLSMEDNKNRSLNLTSTLVSKYLKNIEMVSNSTVSTTTQKPDEFIKPYLEKLITHTSTQNPMLNPIKAPVNKSSGSLVPNISQDIVTLYYDAYDPYDDQENILRNKGNEFSLPSEPITTITPLISDNTQIDSLSTILAPTISPSQTKLQTTNYKKTLDNNNLEQNLRLLQELLRIQANMVTTGQKSTIPQVFSSTSTFTTTTLATRTMKPITIATTTTIATTNTITANATIEKTNKLSNSDDIRFLINLRQLLFGQQQQTSIEKPYEPKNVPSNTTPTILRKNTIPSTTPKKTTTTHTTTTNPKLTTHTTTPATQSYSTPTVKPLVNFPTVRSLSNIKSNTIEQLLNSFQNTRTTLNPNKNRDVEFLSALRQFAKFNNIVMAKPTTFADRLVETALQNQLTSTTSSNNSTTTTTQKYQPQTSRTSNINFIKEFQTEQEDLKSINDDLVLLSSLLGRKVSIADIPSLRNEIITNRSQKQAPTPKPRISTEISKNQATEIGKNLQLLSSLLGRQTTINELPLIMSKATEAPNLPTTTERTTTTTKKKIISTTASASKLIAPTLSEIKKPSLTREQVLGLLKTDLRNHEDIEVYGKSNEALLASVLKQIGIGPDLFVIEPNSTPYTTTQAPRKPPPLTRRPIIEGIQWLWKTWQETAPTTKKTREKKHQSTTASTMKNINYGGRDALIYTNHAEGDDDLSFQAPLTGFDGGAFITTAISITRAVSSFLGTALTGAAKTVSGALEGNEPEFYNLSGKR